MIGMTSRPINNRPTSNATSLVARCRIGLGLVVVFTEAFQETKLRTDRYRCLPQVGGQEGSVVGASDFGDRRRLKTERLI